MQTIPIKIRRMNSFCISNTCNPTDLFHSSTSVYRIVSRNHFRHRAQRALRAQHLMTSCSTPAATEAAARAQRRLSYKPCPRRVPLRGMRSETKGSAPQRAAARRRAVGKRQAPPAAGVPVEGAGVPVVVDVVGEGAAGTGVPEGVPVEGGAGTGVPGGVTAEPAAEEPVEGAGAPGVAPPVGEPPCCALAPCFFLSRCTKLTA